MQSFRSLKPEEVVILASNGNFAIPGWSSIKVSEGFRADKVHGCHFIGEVRLGAMSEDFVEYDKVKLPIGIYNSFVSDSSIGDNCSIYNVRYLGHYHIADNCFIFDVHELRCTPDANFGNAAAEMHVMNETGNRIISPFAGMLTADAYLWAKYIDDLPFQSSIREITNKIAEDLRGKHGEVGENCVIKGCNSIRNCMIGPFCRIDGATRLNELSILSSEKERVEIGENVVLSDGIMSPQSKALHACMALTFVLGANCCLKLGARLTESVVGDNSTIACCETAYNLIFPAHEQHHDNSFLIASCIQGQSNIAAGSTIGSNHNSRGCDNETLAGRGFWPGLCTSFKHSSVFACYTLLAKGAYPAEINIKYPFCLVNNNETDGILEIMPAYWWMYNMYALARNNWKFCNRDKRITKAQHIEFGTYAPDSMSETLNAYESLKQFDGQEYADLPSGTIEKSKRPVRLLKISKALAAYKEMLIHYLMSNVLAFYEKDSLSLKEISALCDKEEYCPSWVNLGGQIVKEKDVDELRKDVCSGKLSSWNDIHSRYDQLWAKYPQDKLNHAYHCVAKLFGKDSIDKELWSKCLEEEIRIQQLICDKVYESRQKDYINDWRKGSYRSDEEMLAVTGNLDEDKFIVQQKAETKKNISLLKKLQKEL